MTGFTNTIATLFHLHGMQTNDYIATNNECFPPMLNAADPVYYAMVETTSSRPCVFRIGPYT